MNSIIPADLLELKARFETWRTNRKYVREPIPDELRKAAAELSSSRASNCASSSRSCPRSIRAISASISAESVEL
jgi:hypothetical protein